MRSLLRNIVSGLLYLVPSDLRFEICRHHANKEFAENRSDFRTNGEFWFLKKILPGLSVVFDVGAHRGEWAAEVLGINKDVMLHCFEPCSMSFSILKKRQMGRNVVLNPFGLGSKQSREKIYILEGSGEGNSLFERSGLDAENDFESNVTSELVEIKKLDHYCLEKGIDQIDFLKIDVEGNELAVIEGGKDLFLNQSVKIVLFEYGGTYIDSRILLKDFFLFFSELNYDFFLLYPQGIRRIPRYDSRLENFQYKNFLIVHRSLTEHLERL